MFPTPQEPTASGNENDDLVQAPDKSWVKTTGIRGPKKNSELSEPAEERSEPQDTP